MQMTRSEAIEIMRSFQNEADMAIDDWGGLPVDRRDLDAMSNDELLRSLNEQNGVEHRHVTAITD